MQDSARWSKSHQQRTTNIKENKQYMIPSIHNISSINVAMYTHILSTKH